MSDSNVIKLAQPGAFTDCLTEILRSAEEIATEIFELPVDVVRRILCHYDQNPPLTIHPARTFTAWSIWRLRKFWRTTTAILLK